MAKKDKQRAELLDPIEDAEKVGTIEASIELDKLILKKKKWEAIFYVGTILPKSYHKYKIELSLDEKPYIDRISDLEKALDDSLFREEKGSRKETGKKIGEIRNELNAMKKECEVISFGGIVNEIKWKDDETKITVRIPDDVVEPINRQKMRLEIYKIALIPIF